MVGRQGKMVEGFQARLRLRQGQAFRLDIVTMAKIKLDVDWGGKILGLRGIEKGLIFGGDRKWW